MNPVDTNLTNIRLFAPEGWDASHYIPCRTLPAHVSPDEIYYSWWRPSLKERLQILFYGFVRLAVWSKTHPPVSVDTYGPDAVE